MLVYLYLKARNRKDLSGASAGPDGSVYMIDAIVHLDRWIGR